MKINTDPRHMFDLISQHHATQEDLAGLYWLTDDNMDELLQRILAAPTVLTYSQLVAGIRFECESIKDPFFITSESWQSGIFRKIIGVALGRITERTLLDAGCVITTIVVDKGESKPSEMLFEWMANLGILPDRTEDTKLVFWADQLRKTHQFIRRGGKLNWT